MACLRSVLVCACLTMACSSGDASPGSTAGNTTTGSGPTTFATFSTTLPPTTGGSGSETGETADDTSGSTGSESSTGTGTVADASSSSTGSGLCPSTHVCMEEAPEGWSGPVAVHQAPYEPKAEPPPCGEAYPDPATAGFEELQAEPATCECSCADPNGVACDNSTVLRYWGDDATCGAAAPQTINIFASSCNTLPVEFPAGGHYSAAPLQAVGGACTPSTDEVLEPAVWSWRSAACEGATIIEDAGCAAGRACAPRPDDPEAALCIWQEGDHECPEAFDTTRTVYGDLDDARGCETCSCSAPNGLCESAAISLWNGPTCLVPSAGVIDIDGECQASGSGNAARAASLNGGSPNAFCVPSEPAPSGEAVGIDPVTVCCVDLGR